MQENKLADGKEFGFWEQEIRFVRELYVAGEDPKASDENDGSKEAPLKTIQAAAKLAKGGDLRIMYPAPEVCLDLKSWREFYGFDQTGAEGWFDFEIDTEKLTLEVKKSETTPPSFGGVAPGRFAYAPKELQRVAADPRVL